MSYICCVDISCLVINVSSGLHGLVLTKVGGGEGRGGEGEEDELEVDTFQQFPKLLEYSDEAVQKNSQKYVRIQNVSIAVTYRPVRALEVSQLIHS